MVKIGYGHQGEEAVIYVAYFKIICAMEVERRDKGSAVFHIIFNVYRQPSIHTFEAYFHFKWQN